MTAISIQPIVPTNPIATSNIELADTLPLPPQWLVSMPETQKRNVKWVTTASVVEHPDCARIPMNMNARMAILASVRQYGILFPLAIDTQGRLLDGRHRLHAAKHLAIVKVPVLVIDVQDVLTFMFEMKASREHLDDWDRAILAEALQQHLKEKYTAERTKDMNDVRTGKKPKKEKGAKRDSRQESADAFNTSTRKVNSIQKLRKQQPEVYQQIQEGKVRVEDAVKDARRKTEATRADDASKIPVRPEDIGNGEMENNIHVGRAQDVLKKVDDGVASLVVFSPYYYGVPIAYDPPLPETTYEKYLEELAETMVESFRVSRVGGRMAVIIDTVKNPDKGGDEMLPIFADIVTIARKSGWKFWMDIVWKKKEASGKKTNLGSFGSCSAPGWGRDHEWVLIFYKDTKKLAGDKKMSDLSEKEHRGWWLTTWDIKAETRQAILAHHPTPCPEELIERLIKMLTFRRGLVIDPYNGSGTTTYCAHKLGRRFIGIDQSPNYCDFARDRIAKCAPPAAQPDAEQKPADSNPSPDASSNDDDDRTEKIAA